MILGKRGDGKSSSCNTIFGEKLFTVISSPSSTSDACEVETRIVNGKKLKVIDTPGFFDPDLSDDKLKQAIEKSVTPFRVDVFIIVLRVRLCTVQEADIIEKVVVMFGEDVLKSTVVLFTHGDQLDDEQTIEDFVEKNSVLKDFVEKCGGRCHVLDNKYWNQQKEGYRSNSVQAEKLLNTIEKMVGENKGECSTIDMSQNEEEEQNLLPGSRPRSTTSRNAAEILRPFTGAIRRIIDCIVRFFLCNRGS
ncbi:GTPase IMAP family member 7-like [Chanos chanos]|uniref:GTPase IMAP family member 7-like n=1 Tax=Chanos chanos TaxID=29144 RepID=A0A6J2VVM2_CHACN|nr:GTPase IMAP family member 7-like [Chanos chanos]